MIVLKANPLLCAANLEFGSNGSIEERTMFGQQMAAGATDDPKHAYRMGFLSCYSNNDETLDALTDKLTRKDTFRGVSPKDPFCSKEYLRY